MSCEVCNRESGEHKLCLDCAQAIVRIRKATESIERLTKEETTVTPEPPKKRLQFGFPF